jgi:hypothetical protein
MPWTPPSDPVTSTVITVAYAVANLLTQIRWLRLMTGNADPPGSSYVVVADSTVGTSWRKVPADALAAGAVTTHLGYTPVNRAGDVMTGTLSVQQTGNPGAGYLILGNSGLAYLGFDGGKHVLVTPSFHVQNDLYVYRAGAPGTGYVILGSNAANYLGYESTRPAGSQYIAGGSPIITAANIAAQSVANAATVAGNTPTATPTANAIPIANASGKLDAWVTSASTDAASVGGRVPTATPTANAIPIADASGKLDAWITPGATGAFVPSGLVALWSASDTAPPGWVLDTTFRDRFVVGAGASYARSATGGAGSHDHGFGTSHAGGAVAADASTPIRVQVSGVGTDPQAPQSGHGHAFTQPGSHIVTNASLSHLPPYIAAHYIRKV